MVLAHHSAILAKLTNFPKFHKTLRPYSCLALGEFPQQVLAVPLGQIQSLSINICPPQDNSAFYFLLLLQNKFLGDYHLQ